MADLDNLAPTMSDEEAEELLTQQPSNKAGTPGPTSKNPGFKFNADTNVKPNFDFKHSATTNGSSQDQDPNNSSSDPDPDEGFEVLGTPEDLDEVAGDDSVPNTPVKLTPHKRAADGDAGSVITNGANGSPPNSPAPKKRKQFKEYCEEFDAKKKATEDGENASSPTWKDVIRGNQRNIVTVLVLLVAIAAAGGSFCYYTRSCPNPSEMVNGNVTRARYSWKKINANFVNWTKMMEPEFSHQNRGTWIQLIAQISETMKKTEPTHPAVITVLFPPSMTEDFATCFVRKVGNIVNKAVAPYYDSPPAPIKEISAATFESQTISNFRTDIEAYFKRQGTAVITLGIDQFKSVDNLNVIQGLCDSYHPVFKRATNLFPVQVPKEIFEKYDWIHERGGDIANDVLNEAWKTTLSADSGPALVARVADAVILLNEGDDCKL